MVTACRDVISGGQGGGHLPPPLILKNSDFLVFLPTTFCIFHIPPPYEIGQTFAPPPWKKFKKRP